MALAGIWLGAVVSDESGQTYWGLRGLDDFVIGMTHVVSPVCGFRSLPKTLESDPPHLFDEYASIDWFEPFEYSENGDTTQLLYTSGRIARDADGLHWYDASGRWEIHGGSPLHVFGNLIRDSSNHAPSRSWCWVEYAGGMLTPEILDMVMQRFRLAREAQRGS